MEEKKVCLQKAPSWCKLKVPVNVINKISLLCSEINNIEWSGILFYNIIDSSTLQCKDILLMDIGQAATTEFDITPEVINYMVNNDLMDYKYALIHSHHNMEAYFSGTDMNTLKEQGSKTHVFLSLIVNNRGNYVACITKRANDLIKKKVIRQEFGFNDSKTVEFEEDEEAVIVSYSDVDIEKEIESDNNILQRINELKLRKERPNLEKNYTIDIDNSPRNNLENVISDHNATLNSNEINEFVLGLLYGTLIHASNINARDIIKKISIFYSNKFEDFNDFKEWVDSYIPFMVSRFIEQKYGYCNYACLNGVFNILEEVDNKYINYIQNSLINECTRFE